MCVQVRVCLRVRVRMRVCLCICDCVCLHVWSLQMIWSALAGHINIYAMRVRGGGYLRW